MKPPYDYSFDVKKSDRMTHALRTVMSLALDVQNVFAFFGEASNLERITPPELQFHIITPHPVRMTQGTRIDYRLRLYGFPITWRTKISVWEPPHCFVDEQVQGPYRLWVHTHRFREQNGLTTIWDEVRYRLPLWPAGEIMHPLIRVQLRRIFCFRKEAIERILVTENPVPRVS